MKPKLEQLAERGYEEAALAEREAEEMARQEVFDNYSAYPVLRIDPETLPARDYDNIEELLSVKGLAENSLEVNSLDEKIKQIEGREYENKLTEPFTILGGMMGIMSGAALFFYGLFSLQRELFPLSNWYALGAVALGVFLPAIGSLAGCVGGDFLSEYLTNKSKKGKQFEQQKGSDLAEANSRKQELELRAAQYRNNPAKGSIVLFESPQTGYSLGYVQSINTKTIEIQQEYILEEDSIKDQRRSIHKLKPADFIYALTPDHDLSPDDLRFMEGEAIAYQANGRMEFGFAKVGGEEISLYTDAKCLFLTSKRKLDEISGLRILSPKKASQANGYRVNVQ
ncbi:MAG: hypothetical protein AABX64_00445 [Nanoarchaeota archaeon]